MIGPKSSNDDWWPRMVMLKVLAQYEEATGDPRVIPLLSRYFAYQLQHSSRTGRFARLGHAIRWQDNALVVIWLYNRIGDPKLLELARLLHTQGFDWQANFADFKFTEPITAGSDQAERTQRARRYSRYASHGVNNGQATQGFAPVWSVISGKQSQIGLAITQMLLHALDTYHGLPNGMFSCDEHFAGRNPSQGSELCARWSRRCFRLSSRSPFSAMQASAIRLEMIAFNALPGTFTDDMWAHQYNQEA